MQVIVMRVAQRKTQVCTPSWSEGLTTYLFEFYDTPAPNTLLMRDKLQRVGTAFWPAALGQAQSRAPLVTWQPERKSRWV